MDANLVRIADDLHRFLIGEIIFGGEHIRAKRCWFFNSDGLHRLKHDLETASKDQSSELAQSGRLEVSLHHYGVESPRAGTAILLSVKEAEEFASYIENYLDALGRGEVDIVPSQPSF